MLPLRREKIRRWRRQQSLQGQAPPIKAGTFDSKTGALKLEGEAKRPDTGATGNYVIEGKLEKDTLAGTFTFDENVQFIQQEGLSVYLSAPFALLRSRIDVKGADRPLYRDDFATLRQEARVEQGEGDRCDRGGEQLLARKGAGDGVREKHADGTAMRRAAEQGDAAEDGRHQHQGRRQAEQDLRSQEVSDGAAEARQEG